jgi:hypothetical protein
VDGLLWQSAVHVLFGCAFCNMEAGPLLPMPDTDPLAITDKDLRGLQGDVAAVVALSIDDDEGGFVPSITVGRVFLPQQRKTKRGQRPAPMMGSPAPCAMLSLSCCTKPC